VAKKLLVNATCRVHPDPADQLVLAVDGLDEHIGGVLQQQYKLGLQLLEFFCPESWVPRSAGTPPSIWSYMHATRLSGTSGGLSLAQTISL
jgi:hypothetical protein